MTSSIAVSMLACLALLSGCATRVSTTVTAYAQAAAEQKKQFILQGPDPRRLGGDPAWPRYESILTSALERKGFVLNRTAPDLVIRVSYRIGDTQVWNTTVSTPITIATGPETEIVAGSTETTSTQISSLSAINIEALDGASLAAGQPVVLWRTHGKSRGDHESFSATFAPMIAAMADYFGTTLPAEVEITRRAKADTGPRLASQ